MKFKNTFTNEIYNKKTHQPHALHQNSHRDLSSASPTTAASINNFSELPIRKARYPSPSRRSRRSLHEDLYRRTSRKPAAGPLHNGEGQIDHQGVP